MTQTYSPAAPVTSTTHRPLRRGLVALWAVFAVGAFAFVAALGTNAPYADEWEFVPALLGNEPAGPWLWQQHNEHRLPLPRAVYLVLFKLSADFRAGMLLQVAMLAALALGLVRLADRLRGRPHWADAFFPVSLLHIGHWENLIMGYQICFVLFAVLATLLAVVALRIKRATAFRSGAAAGALLMLLALTGGSGLVVVPPVAAWLVYVAVTVWRSGEKGRGALLFLLAVLPLAYLAAYASGYERPAHHPPPCTDLRAVRVAGEVLAMSFGIAMTPVWPAAFAAVLALGAATVAVLLPRWSEPGERLAVAGLFAVAAGVTGVAVAIGVGRGGMGGDMGLWSRYSMLSWPLLAASYLVWAKRGRKWVPVALCVAASFAFMGNTGTGMINGASVKSDYAAIEADVASGLSAEQVVDGTDPHRRFPKSAQAAQTERAAHAIPMLRAARVGIFAGREPMRDMYLWWWVGGGALVFALLGLAVRWLWLLGRAVHVERCRELFRLQHERFEEQLLKAAGATGLPRGLRWVGCRITGDAVLVRDTATAGIVALVPVRIDFVPVEGGDMEDVPAAREPRPATAVFTFHGGAWHTGGRVVFNHTPDQTVTAFPELQRLPDHA